MLLESFEAQSRTLPGAACLKTITDRSSHIGGWYPGPLVRGYRNKKGFSGGWKPVESPETYASDG